MNKILSLIIFLSLAVTAPVHADANSAAEKPKFYFDQANEIVQLNISTLKSLEVAMKNREWKTVVFDYGWDFDHTPTSTVANEFTCRAQAEYQKDIKMLLLTFGNDQGFQLSFMLNAGEIKDPERFVTNDDRHHSLEYNYQGPTPVHGNADDVDAIRKVDPKDLKTTVVFQFDEDQKGLIGARVVFSDMSEESPPFQEIAGFKCGTVY